MLQDNNRIWRQLRVSLADWRFIFFICIFKFSNYNATSACVPKFLEKSFYSYQSCISSCGRKVLLTHCWCHQSSGFSQECLHHSCSHQHQLQRICPNQQFPSHSCQSERCFQGERQQLGGAGWCTWSERGLCGWSGWCCCEDNQHPRMEHLPPAAEGWPAPASKS